MSDIILGIESSCDDTSAAVIRDGYLREDELDYVTVCDTPEEVLSTIRRRVVL